MLGSRATGRRRQAQRHEIQESLIEPIQTRQILTGLSWRQDGRRCWNGKLGAKAADPGLERVERRREGPNLVHGRRPVRWLVDLLHVLLEECCEVRERMSAKRQAHKKRAVDAHLTASATESGDSREPTRRGTGGGERGERPVVRPGRTAVVWLPRSERRVHRFDRTRTVMTSASAP